MQLILAMALLLNPSTPEEFLDELCLRSNQRDWEYWSSAAFDDVSPELSDLAFISEHLDERRDLTVDPGPRTDFQDLGSAGFRIEYEESVWTWVDGQGITNSKKGFSAVISNHGDYAWSDLAVLHEGSARMGHRERMVSGILLTFVIMIIGGILLFWAKRRYQ